MKTTLQPIREWHDVDDATFRNEIAVQYRPAILRGFVRQWPVVRHALQSPEAVCRYLMSLDSGKPVDVSLLPPEARGRVFTSPS